MDLPAWLPFIATIAVNMVVVAYLAGSLRAEVRASKETVDRHERRIDELFRTFYKYIQNGDET